MKIQKVRHHSATNCTVGGDGEMIGKVLIIIVACGVIEVSR